MKKRTFLQGAAGAALVGGLPPFAPTAGAASWPTQAITIVVPLAPGGSSDGIARLVAKGMAPALGQPVVVDNKAGAGGSIGATYVAKAKADGYTLLYATSSHSANMSLYKPPPFDLVKDYAPVTVLARPPLVMVVNASLPASSVPEFIAWAKGKSSGPANYGSAGNGTNSHMAAALFAKMAGLQMQHIPFKGGAPANMELMAGRIDVVFGPLVEMLPYLEGGKLKVLATCGPTRTPRMPNAAPIADTLPGYNVTIWHGLMAPAGTDPAVVAQLSDAARKALLVPDVAKQFASEGTEVVGNTPQQFASLLPGDISDWAKLVVLSDAKIE